MRSCVTVWVRGGRAAVDGQYGGVCYDKTAKGGTFSRQLFADCELRLMVKSEDESLSTVDVTSVDLYTGKTTFKSRRTRNICKEKRQGNGS